MTEETLGDICDPVSVAFPAISVTEDVGVGDCVRASEFIGGTDMAVTGTCFVFRPLSPTCSVTAFVGGGWLTSEPENTGGSQKMW